MIYVIWRSRGSRECYVGQAGDAEGRFYRHFMYGEVPFLPTIEGLEEIVRNEEPGPYYEVVDVVSKNAALGREQEIAAELAEKGFVVHGGR